MTTQTALYLAAGVLFALVFRRSLWRFATGLELTGRPRTNHTAFHRGDRVLHVSGRAGRWGRMSYVERSLIRLVAVGLAGLTVYGYVTDRTLTGRVAVAVAAVAVAAVAAVEYVKLRRWQHRRKYVRPLHQALAPVVGVDLSARPESWLTVPLRFNSREGKPVKIRLPRNFTGEARKSVESIVRGKLSLTECDAEFRMVGQPVAVFRKSPKPPGKVPFSSVRELVDAAPESAPLIGLGRRAQPVSIDLDSESPHVAVSGSTGAGKTVTVRTLVSRVLNTGGLCYVLDVKRISHPAFAHPMPNVKYVRAVEDIHDALIWLKGELDRRNTLVEEGIDVDGNTDHVDFGPRLVVVLEEVNATTDRLRAYWGETREKSDPKTSPAISALGDLLFMGRAVRLSIVAAGQMITAASIGGPAARECFGARVLSRYSYNAWRMMVPEITPIPKATRHPGRLQVCLGGQAHETQGIFMTNQEARDYALSGSVASWERDTVTRIPEAVRQSEQGVTVTPRQGLHLVTSDSDDHPPVGLSEAIDSGILTVSLRSARTARGRDADFPSPVGRRGSELLYDPVSLAKWERNRPRGGQVAGGAG